MGPRSLPFLGEVFHRVLEGHCGGQEHLAQRAQLPGPFQGGGPSSLNLSLFDGQTSWRVRPPSTIQM